MSKFSVYITIGILLPYISSGAITGYFRADDKGKIYVDGVPKAEATQWDEVVSFSAPDQWQVLAFGAEDTDGSHAVLASLGDTYTNTTAWRCSSVTTPGWKSVFYDDSNWGVPTFKYDMDGRFDSAMHPATKQIWGPDDNSVLAFCRFVKRYRCDLSINKGNSDFKRQMIPIDYKEMKIVETIKARSNADCGRLCLQNVTSCYHTAVRACEAPGSGCCGYIYNIDSKDCTLVTNNHPFSAENLIVIGNNSRFYRIP